MDKQRWQEIQGIFKHLSDKSPSHRSDYLDMVCEDDPELRSEVEELLQAHDQLDKTLPAWADSIQGVASSLEQPQQVGEYRLIKQIGRGGMGVVHLAEHARYGQVALKLLPRFITESDAAQTRFQQEAHILDQLQHPNLCALYETFSDQDYTGLAMEYIDGTGLDQRLKQGPLDFTSSLKVIIQLADVLALVHSQALAHRDIKPSNILLMQDGTIKLIDFGIAKFADTKLTMTGQVMGTPSYMSPEQWLGKPIDYRSDLWSLGVLLYELLTGETPFAANDRFAVARRILDEPRPRLPNSSCDGQALNELEWVYESLLQKQAEKRLSSCNELAKQLSKQLPT